MIRVRLVHLGVRARVDQAPGLEQRICLGDGERQRDGIALSAVSVSIPLSFVDALIYFKISLYFLVEDYRPSSVSGGNN